MSGVNYDIFSETQAIIISSIKVFLFFDLKKFVMGNKLSEA